MRLTKQRADDNRARIIAEAGRLFKQHGFDGIGVAALMQAAGFTHGGFYNHFNSKSELEALVAREILEKATANLTRIAAAPAHDQAYADYVRRYLSPAARDTPSRSCPIAALGADVARQDATVQTAFAEGLRLYIDALQAAMPTPGDAVATLATLLGGLVLARAVAGADDAFSQEILEKVQAHLLHGSGDASCASVSAAYVGQTDLEASPT